MICSLYLINGVQAQYQITHYPLNGYEDATNLENLSQEGQVLFAHFKWKLEDQQQGPTKSIVAHVQG